MKIRAIALVLSFALPSLALPCLAIAAEQPTARDSVQGRRGKHHGKRVSRAKRHKANRAAKAAQASESKTPPPRPKPKGVEF